MITPYDMHPRSPARVEPMDAAPTWPRLTLWSVRFAKIVIFVLLPICFIAWLDAGK